MIFSYHQNMEIGSVDLTKFMRPKSGVLVSTISELPVGGCLKFRHTESKEAWSARSTAWRHAKKTGKKFSMRDVEGWLVLARLA